MFQLTEEQKQTLKKYIDKYLGVINAKEWQDSLREHKEHSKFFSEKLSKENIDKITELDFREMYKMLWASQIWGNKDWYINNRLLGPNDLQNIKSALKNLLYGEDAIDQRIDKFRNQIHGFGIAAISEILNSVFPEKYCLWNSKPKTVLPYLRINLLPDKFFKYNILDGEEYLQCLEVLTLIKNEMSNFGFKTPSFIDLECLFWYIFSTADIKPVELKKKTSGEIEHVPLFKMTHTAQKLPTTHEEVEYYLIQLGNLLGYATYTADPSKKVNGRELRECAQLQEIPDFTGERDKNSAREIDVIWFDENENPKLCLEVEHSTTITVGLNRLYQLRQFNVNFVIVADEDKRRKFEIEINKAPYRGLRDRYRFVSYEELIGLYNSAVTFISLRKKLIGNT